MEPSNPDLLDAAALARVLKLEKQTIYRMCRTGDIPHLRLSSKCLRFDRLAVADWLREKAEAARA